MSEWIKETNRIQVILPYSDGSGGYDTVLSILPGHPHHSPITVFRRRGKAHREDGPAVFSANEVRWARNENFSGLHNDSGPAFLRNAWKNPLSSSKNQVAASIWAVKGEIDRSNAPALICSDGSFAWVRRGIFFRVDGPAVITKEGIKEWHTRDLSRDLDTPIRETFFEVNSPRNADNSEKFAVESKEICGNQSFVILIDEKMLWRSNLTSDSKSDTFLRTFISNNFSRVDGPAVEFPDGTRLWVNSDCPYEIGEKHKVTPIMEKPDGSMCLVLEGEIRYYSASEPLIKMLNAKRREMAISQLRYPGSAKATDFYSSTSFERVWATKSSAEKLHYSRWAIDAWARA
ncbi:MAG: hypothetical protein WBA28_02150, partial [Microbacteriaceae bacterium]